MKTQRFVCFLLALGVVWGRGFFFSFSSFFWFVLVFFVLFGVFNCFAVPCLRLEINDSSPFFLFFPLSLYALQLPPHYEPGELGFPVTSCNLSLFFSSWRL